MASANIYSCGIFVLLLGYLGGVSTESKTDSNGRIIGGIPVNINQVNHQVAVMFVQEGSTPVPICGGSIITNTHVLTAATCLYLPVGNGSVSALVPMNRLRIFAGSNDVTQNVTLFNVNKIVVHESFNLTTKANDVAVLRIAGPFTLGANINVISLRNSAANPTEQCSVSGWGVTNQANTTYSRILMRASITIADHANCTNAYNATSSLVTGNQICAGSAAGTPCWGDGGAPMVCGSPVTLVGVASFSNGCGQVGYPAVFTEVFKYRTWIIQASSAFSIKSSSYSIIICIVMSFLYLL